MVGHLYKLQIVRVIGYATGVETYHLYAGTWAVGTVSASVSYNMSVSTEQPIKIWQSDCRRRHHHHHYHYHTQLTLHLTSSQLLPILHEFCMPFFNTELRPSNSPAIQYIATFTKLLFAANNKCTSSVMYSLSFYVPSSTTFYFHFLLPKNFWTRKENKQSETLHSLNATLVVLVTVTP